MSMLLQSAARVSRSATILHEIRDEDCNLAIWQRPPMRGVECLLAGDPTDLRFVLNPGELASQMPIELKDNGFAAFPEQAQFIADVEDLAELYCAVMRLESLEVRLEVVTTDSCRKFHADYVSARLITTYVGAGTQWINREDAVRVSEGLEPLRVNSLSTGDVGLFKGKIGTDQPAIHRSPPIGDTGQRRLLLVFNPAKDR